MQTPPLVLFAFLSSAYPLLRAARANRYSSLRDTLWWAKLAWIAWGIVLLDRYNEARPGLDLVARYFALCLTGGAALAVLGARRPIVGAWNFVIVGLLAVFLLPVAQGWLIGNSLHLNEMHSIGLAALLGVTILNYVPTRLGLAATVLGLACVWEAGSVLTTDGETVRGSLGIGWLLALAPWFGWLGIATRRARAAFDGIWLDFRDRYGFLWAQRLRDQFNAAVRNADCPVYLRWRGLEATESNVRIDAVAEAELVFTLRALMKRFGVN